MKKSSEEKKTPPTLYCSSRKKEKKKKAPHPFWQQRDENHAMHTLVVETEPKKMRQNQD